MSSKTFLVVAVAATACIASTQAFTTLNKDEIKYMPLRKHTAFDEEQHQDVKAGIKKAADILIRARQLGLLDEDSIESQGLGKTLKKAAKVVSTANQLGLLDEEQWQIEGGISGGPGGGPNWNIGISHSWEEDEAEQKWKGWKKIEKGAKKAAGVALKAKELGLLEEGDAVVPVVPSSTIGRPRRRGYIRRPLSKLKKEADNAAAVAAALLEEDAEQWKVDAGISGNGRGRPNWNVGISHSWDEDEAEQKWKGWKKFGKIAKQAAPLLLLDEDEEQLTIDGGISGNPNGIEWKFGFSHTFDEDQQ